MDPRIPSYRMTLLCVSYVIVSVCARGQQTYAFCRMLSCVLDLSPILVSSFFVSSSDPFSRCSHCLTGVSASVSVYLISLSLSLSL